MRAHRHTLTTHNAYAKAGRESKTKPNETIFINRLFKKTNFGVEDFFKKCIKNEHKLLLLLEKCCDVSLRNTHYDLEFFTFEEH